jgi:hypothetical protein
MAQGRTNISSQPETFSHIHPRARTNGLDDHGVDLVRAKLELVAGEAVGEAKDHGVHLALRQARDERRQLATDTTEQLVHARVVHTLDAQLVLDQAAELGLCHRQRVLHLLAHDIVLEKGPQACPRRTGMRSQSPTPTHSQNPPTSPGTRTLGQLAVGDGGRGAEGLGRVLKLAKRLELDPARHEQRSLSAGADAGRARHGPRTACGPSRPTQTPCTGSERRSACHRS